MKYYNNLVLVVHKVIINIQMLYFILLIQNKSITIQYIHQNPMPAKIHLMSINISSTVMDKHLPLDHLDLKIKSKNYFKVQTHMYSKYQNIIPWYIVQTVEKKFVPAQKYPVYQVNQMLYMNMWKFGSFSQDLLLQTYLNHKKIKSKTYPAHMYQVVFSLFRNWTTTVTFELTDTFINSVRITVGSTPETINHSYIT